MANGNIIPRGIPATGAARPSPLLAALNPADEPMRQAGMLVPQRRGSQIITSGGIPLPQALPVQPGAEQFERIRSGRGAAGLAVGGLRPGARAEVPGVAQEQLQRRQVQQRQAGEQAVEQIRGAAQVGAAEEAAAGEIGAAAERGAAAEGVAQIQAGAARAVAGIRSQADADRITAETEQNLVNAGVERDKARLAAQTTVDVARVQASLRSGSITPEQAADQLDAIQGRINEILEKPQGAGTEEGGFSLSEPQKLEVAGLRGRRERIEAQQRGPSDQDIGAAQRVMLEIENDPELEGLSDTQIERRLTPAELRKFRRAKQILSRV